ncbi:hypothetical protein [Hominifimenecus sp. rT4P-3]|uniref:hypothetical protein n=1 Tax=Hominifimenecus sp. rT4P-3 TaxID=3242979 RepID=UPI003DA5F8D2
MELIKCKKCGKEFNTELEECPECKTLTAFSREFGVPYYSKEAAKTHNHKKLRRGLGIASIILSLLTAPTYVFWAIYFPVNYSFATPAWIDTLHSVLKSSNAVAIAALLWLFSGITMIAMSDIKAKDSYIIPSAICLGSAIAQLFASRVFRIGAIWAVITFGFAAFYLILVFWED